MDQLANAIISMATAAIIAGIIGAMSQLKNGTAKLIRLICGLFLTFHILAPIKGLNFDTIEIISDEYITAGEEAAMRGKELTIEATRARIKTETESYILDKAAYLGASLEVDVTVSHSEIPAAEAVLIRGNLSPYARIKLQQIIESELGVPREKQSWIE